MKDYHINVYYSEEDHCWIADIPDLRVCKAHGDTPEEAVRQVEIAKQGWLETARKHGRRIPEPRYQATPPPAERVG